jgi:hypothetical protein
VGSVEVVVWETGTAGREILCPASHPPKNVSGFFLFADAVWSRQPGTQHNLSRSLDPLILPSSFFSCALAFVL